MVTYDLKAQFVIIMEIGRDIQGSIYVLTTEQTCLLVVKQTPFLVLLSFGTCNYSECGHTDCISTVHQFYMCTKVTEECCNHDNTKARAGNIPHLDSNTFLLHDCLFIIMIKYKYVI